MKDRCLNEKSKDYPSYAGRGIKICQQWIDSFEAFYKDMGEKPKGTSLDRIDVNGNYSKENCRWATASEQQRNKRIAWRWEIDGKIYESLQDAANQYGVSKQTIVKWVDGYFDKRRNKTWSGKDGCRRLLKSDSRD